MVLPEDKRISNFFAETALFANKLKQGLQSQSAFMLLKVATKSGAPCDALVDTDKPASKQPLGNSEHLSSKSRQVKYQRSFIGPDSALNGWAATPGLVISSL